MLWSVTLVAGHFCFMDQYVQITFENLPLEAQEILIGKLAEIGFEGFEEKENFLYAFISEKIFDQKKFDSVISEKYTFKEDLIPAKNWNEEWEQSFHPITVNNFCVIRASFHAPVDNANYEIIITPKMSFGTGHHATTYLMIELMRDLNFTNKTVLDFGTGTGILAILAEKMGARTVIAMDHDDWSIINAQENIHTNKCLNIHVQKRDALVFTENFDFILANISKNTILLNIPAIKKHLTKNGVLLISGFLDNDKDEMEKLCLEYNLIIVGQREKNNWLALKLKSIN